MQTLEVMIWFIFILVISLLFFAAFGSNNSPYSSIEEYMDRLINEERRRDGS
jgi:hypothetical protein